MGYLDEDWTPVDPAAIAANSANDKLTFQIGEDEHEVLDGDTVKNLTTGQSYRIEGLTAPEISKPIWEDGEQVDYTKAEAGGLEARYNLWSMIKSGGFTNLTDMGAQQYGGGAGKRNIARFTNNKGEDLSDTMYGAGLADVNLQTDQRGVNAAQDRKLQQSLFGANEMDEQYGHLKQHTSEQPLQFKGLALNERWFDPDYYAGVQFRDSDAELYDDTVIDKYGNEQGGGAALNPLSTAWSMGWANTQNEIGAALDALGTGVGSETVSQYGRETMGKAGTKLSKNPYLKTVNVTDIDGDGFFDTTANALEWLGVNTAMTIPYMAAIAAPALIAAPFTGGGSLAVAGLTTAAITPALALHAGNVWNQIDAEHRTPASAGKAFVAGLGMTLLDRFALGKLLKPSSILTKAGQKEAIAHIAIRDGISETAAKRLLNTAVKEESQLFLKHMGAAGDDFLRKSGLLKDSLAAFARAAPVEAVTEVGQELTAYLTAARINGDTPDPDVMLHLAINAGAAGGAIGGGFGVAGTFITAGQAFADRQGKALLDSNLFNNWAKVYYDQEMSGNNEGSQETRIEQWKTARDADGTVDDEGRFFAYGEQSKRDPVWKQKLIDEDGNLQLNPIKLIETATHYTGRLVKAPLLNWIQPDDLRENYAIREIVGRLMNNRGIGGPGKHWEARRNYLEGTFIKVLNENRIKKLFNIGDRPSKARDFSIHFRKFGRSEKGGPPSMFDLMVKANRERTIVSDDVLANHNLTREQANALFDTAKRANRFGNTLHAADQKAIELDYGKDSKEAKDHKDSKIEGWWWKHNSIDRNKVSADRDNFTKFVQERLNKALGDADVSDADKTIIRQKTAEQRVEDIINGDNTGPVDDFSLVEGIRWAGKPHLKRLLDLSNDERFEKWGTHNIFDTYRSAAEQAAKRISHMEYFGDGGRDLDYLFRKAVEKEEDRGLSHEDAVAKVGKLALSVRNVIDAGSSNYNRIQNRNLAGIQRNILSYLTLVSLPLAALASLPEFASVLMDTSNSAEAKQALNASTKAFRTKFADMVEREGMKANDKLRSGTILDRGIDGDIKVNTRILNDRNPQAGSIPDPNQAFLEELGIEESASSIYQKLGVDESISNSEWTRWVMDKFFTITQIRGITQLQRTSNAGFAVDFAYNRLSDLAKVPEGKAYSRDEGLAYEQLRALGMDVPKMLKIMKRKPAPRSAFDVATGGKPKGATNNDFNVIKEEMETLIANFVNERIQNPGAANRPLLFQDPHFAMLTLFNGFMSTFTANVVPKLWNDKFGKAIRYKHPQLGYNAFALIMVMIALGGMGQYMKDWLKFGKSNPYLEDHQLYHRALLSSGVFGQYEKVLDLAYPLYTNQGESVAARAGSTIGGPLTRAVGSVASGFKELKPEGSTKQAIKNFLTVVPGVSAMPAWRDSIGSTLTGDPTTPWAYYDKFK